MATSSDPRHGARTPIVPSFARTAAGSLALQFADAAKWCVLRSYPLFERTVAAPTPRWAEPLGARAALRAALHAYRRVPAYREFVDGSGWSDDPRLTAAGRLARLPTTDKERYIRAYPTAARCLDGYIPLIGTEIDESSGSSGVPFNWVRSAEELTEMHRELSQFARYLFAGEVVTLNGFSMGAWSTGVNTAEALRRNGIVKSPGPDTEKIVDTMRFLGPSYVYVITGYPPFLRALLEYGDAVGHDWRPYRMFGVVGGEGMSEQLRDRLLRRFVGVYSAYGASDLDIGVAAETPASIWLRRRAADDPELRGRLFGDDPRLPMVFQYNPLDYHIEGIDGELVVTVSRLRMLSPRIRYNIHDAGGERSFRTMSNVCRDFGLDLTGVEMPAGRRVSRLPFLFVHGRSDATISYMGANIYPEDVEQALYADADLADRLGAFCLELRDIGSGDVRPCVHVELTRPGSDDLEISERLRVLVVRRLEANSRDYRSAVLENPSAAEILVELHGPNQGPFGENGRRIKRRYIVTPK
jgi:phenylacetate-CoA ligase